MSVYVEPETFQRTVSRDQVRLDLQCGEDNQRRFFLLDWNKINLPGTRDAVTFI